jgi:hypothetical protein
MQSVGDARNAVKILRCTEEDGNITVDNREAGCDGVTWLRIASTILTLFNDALTTAKSCDS